MSAAQTPHRPAAGIARRPAAPGDAGGLGGVGEASLVVQEEAIGVAVHVGHGEIEVAVLVGVEPHRADGLARIGEAERRRHVAEAAAVVAEEGVGPVAEADEEIEVAVAVGVHPRRLPNRAGGDDQAGGRGLIGEAPAVVAIQPQHRTRRPGREAEQQIRIAIGVVVPERRGPRRPGVGDAGGGRDVGEHPAIVAVEAVGGAVEAHEQIRIAVALEVGERVDQVRAGGERLGLHRLRRPPADPRR